MIDLLGRYTIPFILVFVPLYALSKKVDIYGAFTDGAREALELAAHILPYVVAIFVAIGVFRASGALDILTGMLQPALGAVGLPGEVLPLAIVRPLSGNGALAIMMDLVRQWGPDSYVGRLASTIQGSSDTTFYSMSVYFGSVGILKTRHAVVAGLAADVTAVLVSTLAVRLVFGQG